MTKRALLSVYRKEGIVDLARGLAERGFEILSTGGTAAELEKAGVKVTGVSKATGFPEILDGRVKTLHPLIHAGILARRDAAEHRAALEKHGIAPIDVVVVNLYPFEDKVAKGCSFDEAVENVDVGGPTMVRAAAKNFRHVAVVVDPADYGLLLEQLDREGGIDAATRLFFAQKAFRHTGRYEAAIAGYFSQVEEREGAYVPAEADETFPYRLSLTFEKVQDLRYGENPHQRAALYRETTHRSGSVADATQLAGTRPSFNNLLDLDAAYRIARDYTAPTVAIVKHTDPVGLASNDELVEAYRKALDTDPVAAFGGIVGVNRELDGATAREIAANSYEAVVAPSFSQAALGILRPKAGLELLAVPPDPTDGLRDYGIASLDFKRVAGGLLVETVDDLGLDKGQLQVVTRRRPTLEELTDLLFAWRAVRHVRSNAIVLARNAATVGVGAAQASRVVSVEIALRRAGDRAKLAVMASDAYFPFPDGIKIAAQAGVTAIIQPGGSIRDETAIEAADRHHLAMVFTGRRHFRH